MKEPKDKIKPIPFALYNFPADEFRKFKIKCINNNTTINDVVKEFIKSYITEGESK